MLKWIILIITCTVYKSFCEVTQPNKTILSTGRIYIPTFKRDIDIYTNLKNKYIAKSINVKYNKKYKNLAVKGVGTDDEASYENYVGPSIPRSPYFGPESNKDGVKPNPELLGTIIRHQRSVDIPKSTKKPKSKNKNFRRKATKNKKVHKKKTNSINRKSKKKTKSKKIKNRRNKKLNKNGNKKNTKRKNKTKKNKKKESKHRSKRSPGQRFRRLIAARDAKIEDYPYVISIQKNDEHWCSGAILNPRLCITTANCMWKSQSISHMLVRAGSRYTHKGGQMAKIQEVMKHPNWSTRKSPDNDLALIVLDRNLQFSHTLHAVDLPNREMLPPFDDFWVTSFGSERRDGLFEPRNSMLQVYYAHLMDRTSCNAVTKRFGVGVSENFICLDQDHKRAPCTRDTGAPAVSDGVLWGLASWGIRKLCGTERYPAMFSYTASHSNMDFILNATSLLMSDKRKQPFLEAYERPRIVEPLNAESLNEKNNGD